MLTRGEETLACAICFSEDVAPKFNITSQFLNRANHYDICQCRCCGFHFAYGCADDKTLEKVYNSAFHSTSQQLATVGPEGTLDRYSRRFPVVSNALERADWLHSMGVKGKLLDVGAGRGFFVKAASSFFDAEGIELSAAAEEFGKRLQISLMSGDFVECDFGKKKFDVITLWDVLASMREPHQVMERVKQLLNPGGLLIFTVPRVTALVPRVLGRYWPLWIPPVNLGYYSEASIEALLHRHGFVIDKMVCRGKRVAVSFVVTKLGRTLKQPWLENAARLIPDQWQLRLNLRDIISVVAVINESTRG